MEVNKDLRGKLGDFIISKYQEWDKNSRQKWKM